MSSGFKFSASAIVSVLLFGVAPVLGGCDRQVAGNGQAEAPPAGNSAAAERGRLDRSHKGMNVPTLTFEGPDGKPKTLAAFKGKPVLVNLWATWCGPCVKEMPTLDAAAATIAVVPIAQDKDRPTIDGFFARQKFARLKPYLDSKLEFSTTYEAALPMSILFDSAGHEVWRSTGGMDWTSAEARALLAEAA